MISILMQLINEVDFNTSYCLKNICDKSCIGYIDTDIDEYHCLLFYYFEYYK